MSTVFIISKIQYTVKPAHAVTSIKQSPVLKGHFLFVPINTGFTVYGNTCYEM